MQSTSSPAIIFAVPEETKGRQCVVHANKTSLEIIINSSICYEIPWNTITFSLGGFDGHNLIIKGTSLDGKACYLHTDFAAFTALAKNIPSDIYQEYIKPLQPIANSRKTWAASLGWIFLGSILAIILLAYLSRGLVLNLLVRQIPVSWERSMGEAAAEQFLVRNEVIKNGTYFDGLNKIFQKLLTANPKDDFRYKLYLVKDTEANAFALPGGSIVVYSGLLKESANAEEVAGVLAHEIQHVQKRHGLNRIIGSLGFTAMLAIFIGDLKGIFSIAREAALTLSLRSYDRDQEREADAGAVHLLVKLNIDPLPFAGFFERLDAAQGATEQSTNYFSTHPLSQERTKAIQDLRQKLMTGVQFKPLNISFNNVNLPTSK